MCAQPHIPQTSPPAHHLEPWLTAGQTGQLLLLLIPPPQGHKPTLAEAFTSSFLKEWEEGQNSATLLSHRALIKFLCQICLHIKKINFFLFTPRQIPWLHTDITGHFYRRGTRQPGCAQQLFGSTGTALAQLLGSCCSQASFSQVPELPCTAHNGTSEWHREFLSATPAWTWVTPSHLLC